MLGQLSHVATATFTHLPTNNDAVVLGPAVRFTSRVARKLTVKNGHVIPQHSAWSNMTLTVISGICRVKFQGTVHTIYATQQLEFPPSAEHQIMAMTDLRAIVTFDASGCEPSE